MQAVRTPWQLKPRIETVSNKKIDEKCPTLRGIIPHPREKSHAATSVFWSPLPSAVRISITESARFMV
jgi:hypothetical protein